MKARKDSTIILLGIIQVLPLLAVLNSTIIGAVLGIIYAFLLWRFWSSTKIGRRFFRALWRATLRLEKSVLGENVEC